MRVRENVVNLHGDGGGKFEIEFEKAERSERKGGGRVEFENRKPWSDLGLEFERLRAQIREHGDLGRGVEFEFKAREEFKFELERTEGGLRSGRVQGRVRKDGEILGFRARVGKDREVGRGGQISSSSTSREVRGYGSGRI